MSVEKNLQNLSGKIARACDRSGRDPEEVSIVAVTKYVSVKTAQEAVEAGIRHLGENRLGEGLTKVEALREGVTWHFIGTLQSKKVKKMIDQFQYIHSLDRLSLAKEIDNRTAEGTRKKCFVQVNVLGEESKAGLSPEEVPAFIEELEHYPAIEIIGLMTMAPLTDNEQELRQTFRKLKQLRDDIRNRKYSHAPCNELSMGMSNDFEIAIEEGATFIRVGSSLVGKEK